MQSHIPLAMLATCLALSACAKPPGSIEAYAMSDEPYRALTCPEIAARSADLATRLAAATAQQQRAASNDVAGVILLGLPLGSMSGQDVATEIAVMKGEAEALRRAALAKNCPPPGVPQ
jgi:hypothetical protein